MHALIGRKLGMTRVFDGEGRQVPVTVLQAGPCTVVQRKTAANDGYEAVQLGFEPQKPSRLSKAEVGHFMKENGGVKKIFRVLREVRLADGEEAKVGDELTVAIFGHDGFVDISAVTKGRGFQGVIRRFGMAGQPASHGHTMHRRPGSIGMREKPGRILKNKKLPGRMGNVRVTTQHLATVGIRPDDHVLLVRGAVPGPVGGLVEIRRSIKKASK